jgi:hypothetical protein
MKKLIGIIVIGIILLAILFGVPSNGIENSNILGSKSEYAAVPPFEKPKVPPKK